MHLYANQFFPSEYAQSKTLGSPSVLPKQQSCSVTDIWTA